MSEQYPTQGHQEEFGHSQYVQPFPTAYNQPQIPVDGFGIAGMVIGLSLLILGWFPVLGIIVAALAIPFSAVGLRRVRKGTRRLAGFAITGLVMGLVGLIGTTLWTVAALTAAHDINQWDDCTDRHPYNWSACDKYLD